MKYLNNFIGNNLFWFLVFPYIIFTILISLLFIYRKDKTYSLSKCIASSKRSYHFFKYFLTIGSLPLYLTLIFYLIPKYKGNSAMIICAILIYLSQTFLAFFPDTNGLKKCMHLYSAFIGGFFTIFFCLLMAIVGDMEFSIRLLPMQFVLISSILLLLLLLSKKIKKHAFIIEIIFILEWVITIFSLAFIK